MDLCKCPSSSYYYSNDCISTQLVYIFRCPENLKKSLGAYGFNISLCSDLSKYINKINNSKINDNINKKGTLKMVIKIKV